MSDKMITFLDRCRDLQDRQGVLGIFPRGAGSWRTCRALVDWRYLEFVCWGRDMDGLVEEDVQIFGITELGRLALKLQLKAEEERALKQEEERQVALKLCSREIEDAFIKHGGMAPRIEEGEGA